MTRQIDPADDAQVKAWAANLAPRREQQVRIIRDLLQHASGDGMPAIDRVFCRRALMLLEAA